MICLAMYGYRVTWHQLFVTYGDCKIEQVKDSCIVWWSYVSGIDLCRVIQGLWNNNYLMFGVVANKEGNGKTLYIYILMHITQMLAYAYHAISIFARMYMSVGFNTLGSRGKIHHTTAFFMSMDISLSSSWGEGHMNVGICGLWLTWSIIDSWHSHKYNVWSLLSTVR